MRKARAHRRAARLQERARAQAIAERKARRRSALRNLRRRLPRRGRTGRLRTRRHRAQWSGMVIVAALVQLLTWNLSSSGALRLAVALLTVLAIPVAMTLTFDRSNRP
jgi:hypothetical protein